MFKISVPKKAPGYSNNILCYWGELIFGEYERRIRIPLEYWTLPDYKKQWHDGIERIKAHGNSCLVTACEDKKTGPLLSCWLFYKKSNKVLIQHHLFVDESYEEYIGDNLITLENCYDFIPAYHTHYKDHEMVVLDADELEKNINVRITVREPKVTHEMVSIRGNAIRVNEY